MHSIIDKKVNLNYRKAVITDGFLFCTKKHVLFGRAFLYIVSVLKKEMEQHFCEVLRAHGEEYLLPLRL